MVLAAAACAAMGLPCHSAGAAGRGNLSLLACSFASCPGDLPQQKVAELPPACMAGDVDCATREDFKQLRAFSKAVDNSLEEPLRQAEKARKTFEMRVCDYRYAALNDQSQLLTDNYGPNGPLLPGGSYLYELRKWSDSVHALQRACNKSGGACSSLIGHLQDHPEDDSMPGGGHGKAGSRVWHELRRACEIGKTRSPVPNDSPVWCDAETGLCEQKSCRLWWRDAHEGRPNPRPWVDDREEYDDLREVCASITKDKPTSQELNEYQHKLLDEVARRKEQFCSPRWVEGYCSSGEGRKHHAECILATGQRCKNGLVLPKSEQDETGGWKEAFEEKPVEEAAAPPLLLVHEAVRPSRPPRPPSGGHTTSTLRGFL